MNVTQCCERVANLLWVSLRLYDQSGRLIRQYPYQPPHNLPAGKQALFNRLLGMGREDYPILHREGQALYGVFCFPSGWQAILGPVYPVESGGNNGCAPVLKMRTFCEGLLLLDDLQWGHGLRYEDLMSSCSGDVSIMREQHPADSLLIARCKAEVQRRLYEKISAKELAETLEVSPAYLSRVFHAEQGITITDYVAQEKIRQAQNLLVSTDYHYETIAYELGFSSQSYFGAVFKKISGMTPKDYRQQHSRKLQHSDDE